MRLGRTSLRLWTRHGDAPECAVECACGGEWCKESTRWGKRSGWGGCAERHVACRIRGCDRLASITHTPSLLLRLLSRCSATGHEVLHILVHKITFRMNLFARSKEGLQGQAAREADASESFSWPLE
jgi:hypothetical protein